MLSSPFTALTSVAAASLPPPMQDSPALHTLWQCRHGVWTLLPELDRVRVAYSDIALVSPVAGVWTARLLRCVSWMETVPVDPAPVPVPVDAVLDPVLVTPLHLSRHLPHKVYFRFLPALTSPFKALAWARTSRLTTRYVAIIDNRNGCVLMLPKFFFFEVVCIMLQSTVVVTGDPTAPGLSLRIMFTVLRRPSTGVSAP